MINKYREAFVGDDLVSSFAQVEILAMDVDGVLTDGRLGLDSAGGETKSFHIADGLGIVVLGIQGVPTAWISGRANPVVSRRAAELNVSRVFQGVRDKGVALRSLAAELSVGSNVIAYIGDDWNDLLAFEAAGVRIAVANAAPALKSAADWITDRPGGFGAVREVCDAILEARGVKSEALVAYLDSLRDLRSTIQNPQ